MTTDTRTETKHRAAACRERAAQYEALAAEAKQRGEFFLAHAVQALAKKNFTSAQNNPER